MTAVDAPAVEASAPSVGPLAATACARRRRLACNSAIQAAQTAARRAPQRRGDEVVPGRRLCLTGRSVNGGRNASG